MDDSPKHAKHNGVLASRQGRIAFMLALTSCFFVLEIVVGYIANSLTLIADAFHMLSDVVALFIALAAIRMGKRQSTYVTAGRRSMLLCLYRHLNPHTYTRHRHPSLHAHELLRLLTRYALTFVCYFRSNNTYGWQRAELMGALINSVFLLAMCLSIGIEAIQRFFEPELQACLVACG